MVQDERRPVTRPERVVWNRLAQRRGELFSRELEPERHAWWWARRHDGWAGRLNRWVDRLRDTTLENVPYVDPTAAADGVRVLVLLHEPAGDAEDHCGFVSRYANDAVSANLYRAADRAGLEHATTLHWNLVPWWIANPAHPPRRLAGEVVRARPRLGEFLDLLGGPPAEVVLLGAPAAKAWDVLARRAGLPWQLTTPTVSRAPHPNPLVHDRLDPVTGRRNGDRLVEVLRDAARGARGETVRPPRAAAQRRRPF
ncbi:hypothetical protein WCD74_15415 [Actinomycetospora sp. OC33-EN08]|uniref:Uracil-DNA glycosylase-like domain-containing protein n=1 Tax=Actinomycetospora aurantiaca TaxID=3129233 RepID=A0ABU8MPC2_9PSEU